MQYEILYALTGYVETGNAQTVLKSSAVGSCVVVVVYDVKLITGGMAHIMLPGKSPDNSIYSKTRFAENAIASLIHEMEFNGSKHDNLLFCILGGANVLKRENDTISTSNVESVIKILSSKNYSIVKKSVGGTERRSVTLLVSSGKVVYTIGNSEEMLFWDFQKQKYEIYEA